MATRTATVWDRVSKDAEHEMSRNAFLAMMAFWTVFGIGLSALMAYVTPVAIKDSGLAIIGLSITPFIGVWITQWSKRPVVSLLGYVLVATSFGALLGPVLAQYTQASVLRIFTMTGLITVVLGFMGAVHPRSLEHWAGWLFAGLIALIIGMLFVPLMAFVGLPVSGALRVLDIVAIVLFSALIIYNLNRATRIERTHDNAIDAAADLYLNVLNLFLHLLSIGGSRKS